MTTTEGPRLERLRGPRQQTSTKDIFAPGQPALPDTWLFYDGAPSYMGDARFDALLNICLELGGLLWATRRRLALLEQVLADKGAIASEAMETVRLDEESGDWKVRRAEFVERLLGSATAILADATVRGAGDGSDAAG